MVIIEETTNLFIQDKKSVLKYYSKRNVDNNNLFSIINNYPFGLLDDCEFKIGIENYAITHFLSKSDISGYDIEKVNCIFKLDNSQIVAIAMIAGDDLICYDTSEKKLFIWFVQTDNGKTIEIEDTLDAFLEKIINNKSDSEEEYES